MQTNIKRRFYRLDIGLHILAWIGFLSLPLLFMKDGELKIVDKLSHWQFWFFGVCFVVPFYLNTYLWTPFIIRHKKYVLYAISILVIGFIYAFWLRPFDHLLQIDRNLQHAQPKDIGAPMPSVDRRFDEMRFPPKSSKPRPLQKGIKQMDIASVYIVFLILILGSSFRVVQYWISAQQQVQQMEHEYTKAELAFLKAQVHPHFLFNTLNNIYSLALSNDPSTVESIYKLSQLMRYYMEENKEEEVDLKEEIQAIQDFISLQKLRIGSNCKLTERYEGLSMEKKIYPFILLPFIENAFKHGLRSSGTCFLDFNIQVTDEFCLMEVRNSVSSEPQNLLQSGTGLKNTQKLLEQLYPNRFNLKITKNDSEFFVKLLLYI